MFSGRKTWLKPHENAPQSPSCADLSPWGSAVGGVCAAARHLEVHLCHKQEGEGCPLPISAALTVGLALGVAGPGRAGGGMCAA